MENPVPLPALGFMFCLCFPLLLLVNSLDSPSSASIVWSIVAIVSFFLCFMLAFLWMVLGRHCGWQNADEKDREAFLRREKQPVNEKWKFRGTMLVFMPLVSNLVGVLAYIVHIFKPLGLSFAGFMCANSVASVFAAIAVPSDL